MARASLAARTATLPLRPDGGLRLGVVSDTHSAPHAAGLRHLAALRPDALLHAGDVGDASVLDTLRAIAPVLAVRGNIDALALPDELTVELAGPTGTVLRILLLHVGVAGPRLRSDVARRALAERASLVVCGHSHVPFAGHDGSLTVFNPGSLGPRRFSLPIVFGVIELGPDAVSLRHVDCETGERWEP